MPKRLKVSPGQAIGAIVDSVGGKGRTQVAYDHQVSERAAKHIAKAAGISLDEMNREVAKHLNSAVTKMAKRLDAECDKVNLSQLPVAMAIAIDKAHIVQGNANAQPTQQINIQINGESADKDKVIKKLFGNAESVLSAQSPGTKPINVSDSVDTSIIDLPPEPKETSG